MKIWNDKEVESLFADVEKMKAENKSLRIAFEKHAKNFKRQPNSVRNYYYKEVDNLVGDKQRCDRLNIDISKHQKTHFVEFGAAEENNVLRDITEMTKNGMSVRSACLKLSDGDLSKMTRLQNKYQNMKKKNNIIPFRVQKKLTENDINSLFLGLVKLIKRTVAEDILERKKDEAEATTQLLHKAFVDLNNKDRQITKLKADFDILKQKNDELSAQISLSKKQEALKAHFHKKTLSHSLET